MSTPDAAAKGGRARARRLTAEKRTEIARGAALVRWSDAGKEVPLLAKYGAPDRPLTIGDIKIPCYVLADGTRVLAQRGLQAGIGMSEGGGKSGARRLVEFLASLKKKGMEIDGLIARADSPIRFLPPHGGNPADGYDAEILPDICDVIIKAAQQELLHPQQARLAATKARRSRRSTGWQARETRSGLNATSARNSSLVVDGT